MSTKRKNFPVYAVYSRVFNCIRAIPTFKTNARNVECIPFTLGGLKCKPEELEKVALNHFGSRLRGFLYTEETYGTHEEFEALKADERKNRGRYHKMMTESPVM